VHLYRYAYNRRNVSHLVKLQEICRITQMVQLLARCPPPPDYYRDNFLELLDFVESRYATALRPKDIDFAARFRACDTDAQRLLVRLLMRKGPLFRVDRIQYNEIAAVPAAIAELVANRLLERCPPVAADQVLALLTRSELAERFPFASKRCGRSATREVLVHALLSTHTDDRLLAVLQASLVWIALADLDSVVRFQVLCFGSLEQDLSVFVLRDLGMQKIESYSLDTGGESDFSRLDILERYLDVSVKATWLAMLQTMPELAHPLWLTLREASAHRPIERRRSRLLNELGRWHERRAEYSRAIDCYTSSSRHPARERKVRIFEKHPELGSAESLLARMSAEPWCPEEAVFSQRRGRSASIHQPEIRTRALTIKDMVMTPGAIESYALTDLATSGTWGVHLENLLPLGLTALAYWDVLFMPVSGAFTHLFQQGPHDLYLDDFVVPRRAAIQARSEALQAAVNPAELLLKTWDEKYGTANALLVWPALPRNLVVRILGALPKVHLLSLIRAVIECPGRSRTGFPDLFVQHSSGGCEFIEVKGPSDQLQPQQRAWLARLDALGIPASVLKYTPCLR